MAVVFFSGAFEMDKTGTPINQAIGIMKDRGFSDDEIAVHLNHLRERGRYSGSADFGFYVCVEDLPHKE